MLFLSALALAHVPHDTVVAAAAPSAVNATSPWYAIVEPNAVSALYRSIDGGASWAPIPAEATADQLLGLTLLDDGTLVARSAARLWWSRDGETWEFDDLDDPAGISGRLGPIAGTDQLLIGTETGLLVGDPGGTFVAYPLNAAPTGIQTSVDSAVVWSGPKLWRWSGTPVALPDAPATVTAAVEAEGTLVVGDALGRVWWWDGLDWAECAPPPADPSGEHNSVRALAVQNGTIYAVMGWRGPFVAKPGCASWEDLHWSPDPIYSGSGAVTSATDAFTNFQVGERMFLAGWMGVGVSADAAKSWLVPPLIGAAYTRGLTPSARWDDDGTILVGGLGAGVLRADTAGRALTPGVGLGEPNTQHIQTTSDPERVYAIVGHFPWVSHDGGQRWRELGAFGEIRQLVALTPEELWVIGGGETEVSVSEDGGETWGPGPAELVGVGGFVGLLDGRRCVSVAEGQELVCEDGVGGWSTLFSGESRVVASTSSFGPGVWPSDSLLIANTEGIWRVDSTTAELELSTPMDPVLVLQGAGADRAFAASTSGMVWVRESGVWRELGLRLATQVTTLMVLPDFEQNPALYAATLDGVFRIDDVFGQPTLTRWGEVEWVDDQASWMFCAGCSRDGVSPGQHLISVTVMEEGQEISASLRGRVLRVWGVPGRGELWVDGVYHSQLRTRVDGVEDGVVTVIGEVSGLAPGWHTLEIVAGRGGLRIDGVEGLAEATPLFTEGCGGGCGDGCGEGSGGGCGDDGGSAGSGDAGGGCGGASVVAGLILLGLRRRQAV